MIKKVLFCFLSSLAIISCTSDNSKVSENLDESPNALFPHVEMKDIELPDGSVCKTPIMVGPYKKLAEEYVTYDSIKNEMVLTIGRSEAISSLGITAAEYDQVVANIENEVNPYFKKLKEYGLKVVWEPKDMTFRIEEEAEGNYDKFMEYLNSRSSNS